MKKAEFEEKQKAYEVNVACRRVMVRRRWEGCVRNPGFFNSAEARERARKQAEEAVKAEVEREMVYEMEMAEYEAFGAGGREAAMAQVVDDEAAIIIF